MPNILPIATCCLTLLTATPVLAAAESHAGHDHAGHAHGPTIALGTVAVGALSVAASAAGTLAAGGDWHVSLRLTPDRPAPKMVRLWVGGENGRGSAKARAAVDADVAGGYGAHVEIPAPLAADARLWIAIEASDGTSASGSIALPTPAGHHAGDGHGH